MDMPLPTRQRSVRRRRYRALALTATLAAVCSLLAACGSDSGKTTLVWYINPDAGGQDKVAENCSKDKPYTIDTQVLPQDASQQRIQLARRLAEARPRARRGRLPQRRRAIQLRLRRRPGRRPDRLRLGRARPPLEERFHSRIGGQIVAAGTPAPRTAGRQRHRVAPRNADNSRPLPTNTAA